MIQRQRGARAVIAALVATIERVAMPSSRKLRARLVIAALVAVGILVVWGCATSGVPEVPAGPDGSVDPVLVTGRHVYAQRCATCHGNAGEGGRGGKLADGAVLSDYPDIEDQIAVVRDGLRSMPSFDDALTPDEIRAVVEYTRQVL